MKIWKSTTPAIPSMLLTAAILMAGRPAAAQPAAPVPPSHFHHLHLNSVNPAAAIEYYIKAFPTLTKATVAGFDGVKTNNIYVLFTKVSTPPPTEPASVIWHFGWLTPDSRKNLERFRTMGLQTIPMYTEEDGGTIDITSDTFPGTLTKAQLADAKAKGVMPTHTAGYQYLRGPDGAMFENNGNSAERFDHLHMFHENPICAQEWYVAHLGASPPPQRGGAGAAAAPTAADCKVPYGEPSWPSPVKQGMLRSPGGRVLVDDVGFYILPKQGPGPLASTRGLVVDHMGLSVADLSATMARLKREGVKVLEDVHPWGTTKAAMIEGPDQVAIELVEESRP
jgi:hypothetical protein